MMPHPYAHTLALAALYNRHCTAFTTARSLGFGVAWTPWRTDWGLVPFTDSDDSGRLRIMSWPWDRDFYAG
jgi:hypothetical protein